MRLLVESTLTQGQRANDFHYCEPGELLRFASTCSSDRGNPDGRCGCARSFTGFRSHRGTTTAMVAEVNMTRDAYVQSLVESYGFPDIDGGIADEADELIRIAAAFPVGAVIEVRGDRVNERKVDGRCS